MLKKRKVIFGALSLTLGMLIAFTSCNHNKSGNNPNNPNNPDNPVNPNKAKSLIEKIAVESANGYDLVRYPGQEMKVKAAGKTAISMGVYLNSGLDTDAAKVTVTLGGNTLDFKPFNQQRAAICDDVKGITAEPQEVKVRVTLGEFFDEKTFMIKEFDESTLATDLKLESLLIGTTDIKDQIANSLMRWRIYDKTDNKVKLTASLSKDLSAATIIVNEKAIPIELGVDKKTVEYEVEFEPNSIKRISFIFSAEGTKELKTNEFALIYTNTVFATVSVDATGRAQEVTDTDLIGGNLTYEECTVTEPKIIVSILKNGKKGAGKGQIKKVTVDGNEVNIEIKNQGQDSEETVATWVCNPALANPGETKTVKVHVEGVGFDSNGAEVANDPLDFSVTFKLVQPISAELSVDADGKGFEKVSEGNERRVYDQNVKIKLVSAVDLEDVAFKGYKDADGKTPEFELTGKEAIALVKLADTGATPSTLKIVAKAKNKSDTTFTVKLRYTAQDDPIKIGKFSFANGSVERKPDPSGAARMTSERATLYILVGQETEEITSIKINDKEMLDKTAYSDPLGIIESAKGVSHQGQQGGTNLNAVIVIGKDDMQLDHNYEFTVSLAGRSKDGHNLTAKTVGPIKVRLPDYGNDNTDFRNFSEDDSMDILLINKVYHENDKAKMFYNYYGIKAFDAAVFTKNPKATVEGFWYKLDAGHTELRKIASDPNPKTTYAENWIEFKPTDTVYGRTKWGFGLDFENEKLKGNGIGVLLYVRAADGVTTSMRGKGSEIGTVRGPYWKEFKEVNLSASFEKLDNNIGWAEGWKDKKQVIDTLEIKKSEWSTLQDNKIYFRAATSPWVKENGEVTMKYHLFRDKGVGNLPDKISDFVNLQGTSEYPNVDNRFTLDVSSLTEGGSMEVDIPVYLDGYVQGSKTPFSAQVFTRKFTIKRLSTD